MRHVIRLLQFSLILAWVTSLSAQPLPHRSWQFQDDNWSYLYKAIPRAKQFGMNRIQLSHHIAHDAEQLWDGEGHEVRLKLVNQAAALAHEHGLKVDMWTHELSGVPDRYIEDGRIRLSDDLWQWVREKYRRLFTLVPDLDGVVLTFAETDYEVYLDDKVVSADPPEQRFVKLIDALSSVCQERGKTLIVRTFVYWPHEVAWMQKALAALPPEIVKRDIVVMTKCVPHDWQPYYPYEPLLGAAAGLPQVVEIDLGQENTGQSRIPHCEVDYVRTVLQYARDKGAIGGVARVERYENHAIDTPNEVNLHAFGRLLQDPTPSADALWQEWAESRYGNKAAPFVISALRRTFDTTNLTFYPLGHWFARHSGIPTFHYATHHFADKSPALWIPSPKLQIDTQRLVRPDRETLALLAAEKELARQYLRWSREDLRKAQPYLETKDFRKLDDYFIFAQDCLEVFHHLHQTLYCVLAYETHGYPSDAETILYRKMALEHIAALDDWAGRVVATWGRGDPSWPIRANDIRAYAKDAKARLPQDPLPKEKTAVKNAVPVRGWILTVYDMPYLRETIKKAPAYGINQIQLSHDIVHHADQLLSDPQRRKDVQELVELGKSLELEMLLWTHELRQVPRRFAVGVNKRVDLDNEELWKWVADRYAKLYELLPKLDGVVLSLDETGPAALTDDSGVMSTMQRQIRVRKLAEVLDEVHHARGKRLVIRDFGESLWARQGIKIAPKGVGAMTKVVFGDWQPYCEPSITYDYYGNRPLWVEYDLCGEYLGESLIPWPDPEYVKTCWEEARRKTSPAGGVARIDRTELWRVPYQTLGTPNEINIEMFCRLMQDPSANPGDVWKQWTVKTYGSAAAPHVEKALRRMAKATKTLYWGERLGDYRIQQHSYLPTFKYALEHDRDYMQTYAIDAEMFLLKPDLIEREMARRYDSVVPMYRAAVNDLEPARKKMESGVYDDLKQRFEIGASAVWAFKAVHTAFLRYRTIEFGLRHEKFYAETVAAQRAKIAADQRLLEKMAADIETKYGDKFDLASAKRIRAFAADLIAAYAALFDRKGNPNNQ